MHLAHAHAHTYMHGVRLFLTSVHVHTSHTRAYMCQVYGSFVTEVYVIALTAAANLVLVQYNIA